MSIESLVRRNVGGVDRGIRLALGLPLLAGGLFLAGGVRGEAIGILIALAGLVSLLTGITARCPLYIPFGFSTARASAPPKKGPETAARGADSVAGPVPEGMLAPGRSCCD